MIKLKNMKVVRDKLDRTARSRSNDKKYIIDNTIYIGLYAIEQSFNISRYTVKKRLESKHHSGWMTLEDYNKQLELVSLQDEIKLLKSCLVKTVTAVEKLAAKDRGKNSDVSKILLNIRNELKK